MSRRNQDALRNLPGVDESLRLEEIQRLMEEYPRPLVVEAVRRAIEELRASILKEEPPVKNVALNPDRISEICSALREGSLSKVINATGVVVHTNLGRSPLPRQVMDRVAEVAAGYSTLEYDLEAGTRGSRHVHAQSRVRALLEAEDAAVVNNNAAAVFLSLTALASGREVVVSRGELVEIGGSFRIPDVMRNSGACLVEVGTTNRTRTEDYEAAITDQTALLLKVHRSNFAVVGFTEEVEPAQLAELGRKKNIPTMMDLGSGCLQAAYARFPLGPFPEPGARAVLKDGIDVVTFSGDKLLGGPQAGIIAGKAVTVEAIRSHALMRAVRPGKLTLAALDAVLDLYQWGLAEQLPTVGMICAEPETLRKRRDRLLERLKKQAPDHLELKAIGTVGKVGGGALPLLELPSEGIAVTSGRWSADELEQALRACRPPVLTRVHQGTVVLDVRTVQEWEIDTVVSALAGLSQAGG